ncbi:MAG: magnesium/cobalt transporter CorA [Spirochaetia bacterium]
MRYSKIFEKSLRKVGAPPGTLLYSKTPEAGGSKLSVISFSRDDVRTCEDLDKNDIPEWQDPDRVSWFHVQGLEDIETIETIGRAFSIHSLLLEDVVNTEHRPKVELLQDQVLVVMRMYSFHPEEKRIAAEQVSILAGKGYCITFQEGFGELFGPVKERIEKGFGKVRKMGSDYLMYALMDIVVDNYYPVLEHISEALEILEDEILEDPRPERVKVIHELRKELIFFRRSVWPLREAVNKLSREETKWFTKSTRLYVRDLYDHIVQVMDHVESFRDIITGLTESYMSGISNRMNSVMKLLTLISTMFIPLTFIAGVYGMNFQYMPELTWRWSYFVVLGVMLVVAVSMLIFFKKKKWL